MKNKPPDPLEDYIPVAMELQQKTMLQIKSFDSKELLYRARLVFKDYKKTWPKAKFVGWAVEFWKNDDTTGKVFPYIKAYITVDYITRVVHGRL